MEADWSVELAADDPVMVIPWEPEGESFPFIDLRENRQGLDEIPEARREPALRSALLVLNDAGSQLWTAKCDSWAGGEVDPSEMDATPDDSRFSAGCYIDILLRDADANASFVLQEEWIRGLAKALRGVEMRCVRAEFLLRRAEVRGLAGFGMTCFVQGCGATAELAASRWKKALTEVSAILVQPAPDLVRFPGE